MDASIVNFQTFLHLTIDLDENFGVKLAKDGGIVFKMSLNGDNLQLRFKLQQKEDIHDDLSSFLDIGSLLVAQVFAKFIDHLHPNSYPMPGVGLF